MLFKTKTDLAKKCNSNSTDSSEFSLSWPSERVPATMTITVIGDSRVGKTSLIRRFKLDKFCERYKPTRGTESTEIEKVLLDDLTLSIHFLDTSDVFIDASTLIPGKVHASLSNCVLIVYDITDHRTFESAKDWVCLVKNMLLRDTTLILVGNKADLEKHRQVHRTAGQVFATLNGMVFVETSAKNGQNLKQLYNYITDV